MAKVTNVQTAGFTFKRVSSVLFLCCPCWRASAICMLLSTATSSHVPVHTNADDDPLHTSVYPPLPASSTLALRHFDDAPKSAAPTLSLLVGSCLGSISEVTFDTVPQHQDQHQAKPNGGRTAPPRVTRYHGGGTAVGNEVLGLAENARVAGGLTRDAVVMAVAAC